MTEEQRSTHAQRVNAAAHDFSMTCPNVCVLKTWLNMVWQGARKEKVEEDKIQRKLKAMDKAAASVDTAGLDAKHRKILRYGGVLGFVVSSCFGSFERAKSVVRHVCSQRARCA